jgi:hypothetical protein
MENLTEEKIDKISSELGASLQELIEKHGLESYEVENLILKPKADASIMGLIPECGLKCTVGGFPPKIDCKIVCE